MIGRSGEWKRRWIILAGLAGIYWGVQLGDWFLESYVLSSPQFTQGATKVTARHFKQPDEQPISIAYWRQFLERIARHKPGILGYKIFYVVLLVLYVTLAIWLFLDLTSDRLWNPPADPDDKI